MRTGTKADAHKLSRQFLKWGEGQKLVEYKSAATLFWIAALKATMMDSIGFCPVSVYDIPVTPFQGRGTSSPERQYSGNDPNVIGIISLFYLKRLFKVSTTRQTYILPNEHFECSLVYREIPSAFF